MHLGQNGASKSSSSCWDANKCSRCSAVSCLGSVCNAVPLSNLKRQGRLRQQGRKSARQPSTVISSDMAICAGLAGLRFVHLLLFHTHTLISELHWVLISVNSQCSSCSPRSSLRSRERLDIPCIYIVGEVWSCWKEPSRQHLTLWLPCKVSSAPAAMVLLDC